MAETYETLKLVTIWYLYGTNTTPEQLVTESLIRESGSEVSITIDAARYMADGGGRFATGNQHPAVKAFFEATTSISPGNYSVSEIATHFNIGPYYAAVFQQYNFKDQIDDAAIRTYIYNTVSFGINPNARFIVGSDGTKSIENYFLRPLGDNFDFQSSNPLAALGNVYLQSWIDPSGIGRRVNLLFDGISGIPSVTYGIDSYNADKTQYNNTYVSIVNTSNVADLISGISDIADSLWNDGVTKFLDPTNRPILYGTRDSDILATTALAAPYFTPYAQNGFVLIGGSGNDHLTGSMGERDLLLGGGGDDSFIASLGVDVIIGGSGNDTLLFQNSDAFGPNFTYKVEDASFVDSGVHYEGKKIASSFGISLVAEVESVVLSRTREIIRLTGSFDPPASGGDFAFFDPDAGSSERDTIDFAAVTGGVTLSGGNSARFNNVIFSNFEYVVGSSKADSIQLASATYALTVKGGAGSDTLVTGTGNDKLHGAGFGSLENDEGDTGATDTDDNTPDRLEGGEGFDTYYVGGGDTIFDRDGKGLIYFNGVLLQSAIWGDWNGNDRYNYGPGGVKYTIRNYFLDVGADSYTVEVTVGGKVLTIEKFIDFDFGIYLDDVGRQEVRQPGYIGGSSGSDTLAGTDGNETFDGQGGGDVAAGGGGDDTYVYNLGYGVLHISETTNDGSDNNVLELGYGFLPATLNVSQDLSGNVLLHNNYLGDLVNILGMATPGLNAGIQSISFVDGTVWTRAEILDKASKNVDSAPREDATISIAALSANKSEGSGTPTPFTFSLTRTGATTFAHSVHWAVSGSIGSGTMPSNAEDFLGGALPSGTVDFAIGETSKQLTVEVAADLWGEFSERFTVTLSDPSPGAILGMATADAVILNDDTSLDIGPTALRKSEGNSGSTVFSFTINYPGTATTSSASVNWAVAGSGAAQADAGDFVGGVLPSGSLTFAPGENSKTVTIGVAGDTQLEGDETFSVILTNPAGAIITNSTAIGTIVSDDATISIAALNASTQEGTGWSTPFTFTLTRDGATGLAQRVNWAAAGITGDGIVPPDTADFLYGMMPSGTVTFAIGETTKVLTVDVVADRQRELNESFAITLSSPTAGAILGTASASAVIFNDDAVMAANDSYATGEDTVLTVPAALGVLANDDVVPAGTLSAVLVSGPSHGALVLTADGGLSYTPNQNYAGPDSFVYSASDGSGHSATATVSIDIAPANDAPVLDPNATPTLFNQVNDSLAPVGAVGMLVSDVVGFTTNVNDVDTAAELGIAVFGESSPGGTLYYSIDNGANWTDLTGIDAAHARLLAADASTRLYFQPFSTGVSSGTLSFVAWDRTSGANGGTADARSRGGDTPFSLLTDDVALAAATVAATRSLTAGRDIFSFISGNNTVVVSDATLNASDQLTGGTGTDTLKATTGGAINLNTPSVLAGFERVILSDLAVGDYDLTMRDGVGMNVFLANAPTTVTANGANSIGINALKLLPNVTLTLAGSAADTVSSLVGDIDASALTGTLAVVTGDASDDGISIIAGSATTSIWASGAGDIVSVNAAALAQDTKLSLIGSVAVVVTELVGDISASGLNGPSTVITGNAADDGISIRTGSAATSITANGAGDTITVIASAMTTSTLTFIGSANAIVSLGTGATVSADTASGNLQINGSTGANDITTGSGADTLFGAAGKDTLTSGAGGDLFRYTAASQSAWASDSSTADTITDFLIGTDKIDLAGFAFGSTTVRSGADFEPAAASLANFFRTGGVAAGSLNRAAVSVASGGNTHLFVDVNGNGSLSVADMMVTFTTDVSAMTATDIKWL